MKHEIDLEKILSKYQHSSKEDILYAMREVAELSLDIAADKFHDVWVKVPGSDSFEQNLIVLRDEVLRTKELIK